MSKAREIVKNSILLNPIEKDVKPSEFIQKYWDIYAKSKQDRSVSGAVFEELLMLALIRAGISPVYYQAKLAFVPNVVLDIVLYNRKTPVTFSAKTTLRERWKQADLEAMATKYVHREAKCYVITLSKYEVVTRRNNENSYMGIDKFILANTQEFDHLIEELKQINFTDSESIKIIQTDDKFYDQERIRSIYQINFE